jgi:transposase
MTRAWIRGDSASQPALLPADPADLLPAGHRAWAVLAFVAELDLSEFVAAYRADGRGRPPYDPAMMLALVLYTHTKGIVSGQDIAQACVDDLGARVICGGLRPDRSAINRFRATRQRALRGLLAQTVRIGHAEGLVDASFVAGDGTKMGANAAMRADIDAADLPERIAAAQAEAAAAHAAWAEAIAGEAGAGGPAASEPLFGEAGLPPAAAGGPDGTGRAALKRLRLASRRLGALEAAAAWLAERPAPAHSQSRPAGREWQAELERAQARVAAACDRLGQARARAQAAWDRRQQALARGEKVRGRKPVPPEERHEVRRAREGLDKALQAQAAAQAQAQAQAGSEAGARGQAAGRDTRRVNATDPSSAVMPAENGGYGQLRDVQAAACEGPFILAVGLHFNANDKQALIPLVGKTRAALDAAGVADPLGAFAFDNGYASEDNFTAGLPVELLLVAVGNEARQTGRDKNTKKTKGKGKKKSKKSGGEGEGPAIPAGWQPMADLLAQPGNAALYKRRAATIEPLFAQLFARFGRSLNFRGEDDVETELHLWAATHNMLKIINARAKRSKRRRPG